MYKYLPCMFLNLLMVFPRNQKVRFTGGCKAIEFLGKWRKGFLHFNLCWNCLKRAKKTPTKNRTYFLDVYKEASEERRS